MTQRVSRSTYDGYTKGEHMVEIARLRGIVIEVTPLSGNVARSHRAKTMGKLRVEPGDRQVRFKSDEVIRRGDVVEFDEADRGGFARNLAKVGKRYY